MGVTNIILRLENGVIIITLNHWFTKKKTREESEDSKNFRYLINALDNSVTLIRISMLLLVSILKLSKLDTKQILCSPIHRILTQAELLQVSRLDLMLSHYCQPQGLPIVIGIDNTYE